MNGGSAPLIVAIRGPVLLVALGVLFAIDQAGSYGFGVTWPVLIILYGLLKLLERAAAAVPTGSAE